MTVDFGESSNRRFVTAGLDPGHANDYSALAVIERGNITDRLRATADAPGMPGRTTLIVDSTASAPLSSR
ncbi:MAG: hypothetical protein FJW39_35135 [Acidobacteria bacterium]|nr:hypothetical protein [Acidobacteriota bacterium]